MKPSPPYLMAALATPRLALLSAMLNALTSSTAFSLDVNAAQPVTHRVTVQPIIAADSDGSNRAEFFGNAAQSVAVESLITTIWAQAGLDVRWLSPNYWSDSTANSGGFSLSALGSSGASAGVSSTDPNILNVFFSEITALGSDLGENSANGVAWIGANGISVAIGDNLVTWPGGQAAIASVVAHEIGHNLGLAHTPDSLNLMQPGGSGERLSSDQVEVALGNRFASFIDYAPGDYDGDGNVDGTDLAQWKGDFGINSGSDSNGDGDSDGNDFFSWQRNFSPPSGVQIIPEPAALHLLLLAILLMVPRIPSQSSSHGKMRAAQRTYLDYSVAAGGTIPSTDSK